MNILIEKPSVSSYLFWEERGSSELHPKISSKIYLGAKLANKTACYSAGNEGKWQKKYCTDSVNSNVRLSIYQMNKFQQKFCCKKSTSKRPIFYIAEFEEVEMGLRRIECWITVRAGF